MSVLPELIVPYTVWHNVGGPNNQYLSYIEKGTSTRDDIKKAIGVGWKKYTTFYAFSPDFIPVPLRTKIITTTLKKYFPYDISDVSIDLDPFYNYSTTSGSNTTLQFLTYVEGVQNCTPLYFHILSSSPTTFGGSIEGSGNEGNVFISYSFIPPQTPRKGIMKRPLICYVMRSIPKGFECKYESCQPLYEGKMDEGGGKEGKGFSSVIECIYHCREDIHGDNEVPPPNLMENPLSINPLSNSLISQENKGNNIGISILVFVGILILLYILYNKCLVTRDVQRYQSLQTLPRVSVIPRYHEIYHQKLTR